MSDDRSYWLLGCAGRPVMSPRSRSSDGSGDTPSLKNEQIGTYINVYVHIRHRKSRHPWNWLPEVSSSKDATTQKSKKKEKNFNRQVYFFGCRR